MKHLGDEFLWPVNYDERIGKGHVPQNITSNRAFFFKFMWVWGLKKPKTSGKYKSYFTSTELLKVLHEFFSTMPQMWCWGRNSRSSAAELGPHNATKKTSPASPSTAGFCPTTHSQSLICTIFNWIVSVLVTEEDIRVPQKIYYCYIIFSFTNINLPSVHYWFP